ncbi:MAG: DUF2163 domain-containing protein [Burkholderiales bacterium]|jgi:uncharacterized phage protein (TIGR02218 family)|nr:DUF2163 domain-containing protein [Burkholderiales bacterium]
MINNPTLLAWLATNPTAIRFDCWTVAPRLGALLQWTDGDEDVVIPGTPARTFVRLPLIERGKLKRSLGLSVDELTLDLRFPAGATIDGVAAMLHAQRGGFDGAEVQLERVYYDLTRSFKGSMVQFIGRVGVVEVEPPSVRMPVKSELNRLNVMMPRNTYIPSCVNDVYDVACGLSKTAFSVNGTVTAVNGSRVWLQSGLSQSAGYFNKGVLEFTSGANLGQTRTVKSYSGGVFEFALPFWEPIAVGNTFKVRPGCNNTMSDCRDKFNNLLRYRGTPFVPTPETALAD